jgi:hypothetical protein
MGVEGYYLVYLALMFLDQSSHVTADIARLAVHFCETAEIYYRFFSMLQSFFAPGLLMCAV